MDYGLAAALMRAPPHARPPARRPQRQQVGGGLPPSILLQPSVLADPSMTGCRMPGTAMQAGSILPKHPPGSQLCEPQNRRLLWRANATMHDGQCHLACDRPFSPKKASSRPT